MASVAGLTGQSSAKAIQSFVPTSSFISLLEYDESNLTLTTHLSNGAIYQHHFVLPVEFDALKTSQNHGKYWSNNIKGKTLGTKVKGIKAPNAARKFRQKVG